MTDPTTLKPGDFYHHWEVLAGPTAKPSKDGSRRTKVYTMACRKKPTCTTVLDIRVSELKTGRRHACARCQSPKSKAWFNPSVARSMTNRALHKKEDET